MSRSIVIAICLYGMSIVGCTTRGRDFSSDMSWIKKDATRKEDVKTVLGEPFQVGYSTGQPTWTYGYYQYRLFGPSHTKELKFYWTRSGVVETYSFSSSFPQDISTGSAKLTAPSTAP